MTVDPPLPDGDPRPTAFSPQQLGFTPQRPVGWLQPLQLSGTAVRVILSQLFGAYLDKRELQNTLSNRTYEEGDEEIWFDFVADIGDGFDSTYTIAYLLAQPNLTVEGQTLPRGEFLMLGGDQVYPTASTGAYEDRTKGPYMAALPWCTAEQPSMYALPGNHDWYDGLTAFLRLFVKDGRDSIGGWVNAQARSYFAIELPQRWWLFAIDTQFGAYLDDPQLEYFHAAARRVKPGDRVILCSATPGWVEATTDPGAYDTIDYFVRTVLSPTGADIRLMLSGDLHHYAHYASDQRHLVHFGGGGAYLYATHELPEQIVVPKPESLSRRQSETRSYDLRATFPTKARSRRYALGVFGRLPWRNKTFVAFLGVIHALFMLALVESTRHTSPTEQRLFSIPVALMALVILAAATFFAMPPTAGARKPRHWILGLSHGAVQLGLGIVGSLLWDRLPFDSWIWPLPVAAAVVFYIPVWGLVTTEIVCLYLLIAGSLRVNLNELFAGQSIFDEKGFLRIHIARDGTLTIYPIAVPRVCRTWTVRPDDPVEAPWLQPAEQVPLSFVEPPYQV